MQSKLSHETATLCERAADCTSTTKIVREELTRRLRESRELIVEVRQTIKDCREPGGAFKYVGRRWHPTP